MKIREQYVESTSMISRRYGMEIKEEKKDRGKDEEFLPCFFLPLHLSFSYYYYYYCCCYYYSSCVTLFADVAHSADTTNRILSVTYAAGLLSTYAHSHPHHWHTIVQ